MLRSISVIELNVLDLAGCIDVDVLLHSDRIVLHYLCAHPLDSAACSDFKFREIFCKQTDSSLCRCRARYKSLAESAL